MVKKFEISSVNYNKFTDIENANKLLNVIYRKIKPHLHEVSNKINKPVIIYGAGNLGKMAVEYFKKLDIKPLFITDKNFDKVNKDSFWKNYEIIKPTEVPYIARKLNKVIVCVVTSSFCEIKNWLNTLGFDDVVPFYDVTLMYQDKHPLNNGWMTSLLDKQDICNIKYVLDRLEDNTSLSHYLQFIAWHSFREEWIFKNATISNKNRYFIPEIIDILADNETFVDIGAHHGEVVEKFINNTKGNFNSIYAIEPDKENFNIMYHNLKNIIDERIFLSNIALGDKFETKKFYHGLDYASQISNLSNEEIKVVTLDSLNIKPTFIKIHAEGNECNIIKGGIKTIMCCRPIIASTIYHNRDGLWKIQCQLMISLEDYVYYFRLHSWCGTGAVIYAIPKEMLK